MSIDYDLSESEEKAITETIKDLDCRPLFVEVLADGFDLYQVNVEVMLAKSNIVVEMGLEVRKRKWVGYAEIINTNQKKPFSFPTEGRLGADAVYKVLDTILATRKISYDLNYL